MMTKEKFFFLFLFLFSIYGDQKGSANENFYSNFCECGCFCDTSCDCGCVDNGVCHCNTEKKIKKRSPSKNKKENSHNSNPNVASSSSQLEYDSDCICDDPCDCGCKESGICHCNTNAKLIKKIILKNRREASMQCGCGCDCGGFCDCGCIDSGVCLCKAEIHEKKNYSLKERKADWFDSKPQMTSQNSTPSTDDQTSNCETPIPTLHTRLMGWSCGRCIHEYPKRCNHKNCEARYWCQAHAVYLGPYDCLDGDCTTAFSCGRYGVWLPEDGLLFKPFIADPRQITYSIGWRFNDQVLAKNVIAVSFGDDLPIYRWCAVQPWGGQMQIDLEGALWGVFDPLHDSSPLINADYYVGIPISYAIGRWGFRLRAYHISSHIGDEFLLEHEGFDRRNPSAEYIDWAVSYYITDEIRFYSNLGWIVQHDDSFPAGNYYIEAGAELRFLEMGFYDQCQNLFGYPFFGMHFHFNNHYSTHIDNTYVLGYEWGKACGNQRRVRAFIEYHNGYSVEGQFRKYPSDYFSINMSYGY
mgnify:CR=1 FL=1